MITADALSARLADRDFRGVRTTLGAYAPPELAGLIEALSDTDAVVAFRLLPRDLAARAFEFLDRETQRALVDALAARQGRLAELLDELAPDDRTALFEELPGPLTQRLLNLLSPDERRVALTLLGYPEGSVGRLMTPDYVAVRAEWTVAEALDHLRRYGRDSETLHVVYVVDAFWHLVDDVGIRDLLLAEPATPIGALMDGRFVALRATDDEETAVAAMRSSDRVALPVTDSAGVLVGIVTVDDVLDVAEEAATEDIQKFGGSEALDDPYFATPFRTLVSKRARWLIALFLGEMLTATAMGYFEGEIERAVVLALFVPLIISSGGNSGSQAATLIIRALALGEFRLRDWWRVMKRELASGLALGLLLGAIGAFRVGVWGAAFGTYGAHWALIALTVACSLVGVVLWGTLAGSMLPFLLKRLGADPATSSAPFVATLVDVTGLVIYFTMAALFLRGTLL